MKLVYFTTYLCDYDRSWMWAMLKLGKFALKLLEMDIGELYSCSWSGRIVPMLVYLIINEDSYWLFDWYAELILLSYLAVLDYVLLSWMV